MATAMTKPMTAVTTSKTMMEDMVSAVASVVASVVMVVATEWAGAGQGAGAIVLVVMAASEVAAAKRKVIKERINTSVAWAMYLIARTLINAISATLSMAMKGAEIPWPIHWMVPWLVQERDVYLSQMKWVLGEIVFL